MALVNTPLFHTAALNTLALNTLYKGGTVVLRHGFDARDCLDAIEEFGVAITFAAPAMLTLLERSPHFGKARIRTLRWVLSGGAPLPPETASRWSAMGVPVIASSGLSEAGPSVTFRCPDDVARKATSSGPPAPLTDLRVVDGTGATVADGLRTGDRGYLDHDGDLVVVGRLGDTIITGGEIEDAVSGHPSVAEAVVVGVPDRVWGQRVTVVVVPVPGTSIDLDEIRDYLKRRLAKYKLPRRLEVWDSILKSPAGKIRRRDIQLRLSG